MRFATVTQNGGARHAAEVYDRGVQTGSIR